MRIIFMGTPEFAVPSLAALVENRHEVIVVTQPDRMRNRNKITPSPVKEYAQKHGLRVLQFESIRKEGVDLLREINADIGVTAAYGQILSQEILDIPRLGIINVHASLLPKYRGSCPVNFAIINGERITGITIMQTALKLDSGDIIFQSPIEIKENETAGELLCRLSKLGATALLCALDLLGSNAKKIKQDESKATFFPMLKKSDGELDFSQSAKQVAFRVQGLNPWPCAYTYYNEGILKIWNARAIEGDCNAQLGEVVDINENGIIVQCGKGLLCVTELQLPNKKRLSAAEFLKGHKLKRGTIFMGQL